MLRAISGMLPKNKLRSIRMERLILFPGSHKDLADRFPHIANIAKEAAVRDGVPFVESVDFSKKSIMVDESAWVPVRVQKYIKRSARAGVTILGAKFDLKKKAS